MCSETVVLARRKPEKTLPTKKLLRHGSLPHHQRRRSDTLRKPPAAVVKNTTTRTIVVQLRPFSPIFFLQHVQTHYLKARRLMCFRIFSNSRPKREICCYKDPILQLPGWFPTASTLFATISVSYDSHVRLMPWWRQRQHRHVQKDTGKSNQNV